MPHLVFAEIFTLFIQEGFFPLPKVQLLNQPEK